MPLSPQGGDLYVSAPLTNISIAWQNGPDGRNYVAGRAFPVIPVARQGDLYWKYDRGDWFRGQAEKRAPSTETVGSGWNVSTDTYYAHVYGLHKDVDDQTRANASRMFNLDRDATLFVTQNLLQSRESHFVTSFMAPNVWTGSSDYNGGGAGGDLTGVTSGPTAGQFVQWDQTGSDPIADVNVQIIGMAGKTGYRPNTMIMGPEVWDALQRNTSILERIKYTGAGGFVTDDILRQVFNVDRLLVTWGIQNPVNQGAAENMGFMSSKDVLLCYTAPTPGLQQPSAGYIFAWSGLLGGGAYGTRIKRFRMENIASDRIEGEMAYDMKVVAPELGVFFDGAVA